MPMMKKEYDAIQSIILCGNSGLPVLFTYDSMLHIATYLHICICRYIYRYFKRCDRIQWKRLWSHLCIYFPLLDSESKISNRNYPEEGVTEIVE